MQKMGSGQRKVDSYVFRRMVDGEVVVVVRVYADDYVVAAKDNGLIFL